LCLSRGQVRDTVSRKVAILCAVMCIDVPGEAARLWRICAVLSPGLLHSETRDWVGSFVTVAGQRFASELAAGSVDRPRLLLRLFSCLTLTSVLHPADVLGLMERLTEVAQAHAAAGGRKQDKRQGPHNVGGGCLVNSMGFAGSMAGHRRAFALGTAGTRSTVPVIHDLCNRVCI